MHTWYCLITNKIFKTNGHFRTTKGVALNIHLRNEEVEQVKTFLYLGQQITEEGTSYSKITRVIEIARGEFSRMASALSS